MTGLSSAFWLAPLRTRKEYLFRVHRLHRKVNKRGSKLASGLCNAVASGVPLPQARFDEAGPRHYPLPILLAYDGDDLSQLPLSMRKTNLAQLLRGRAEGIFVAPFEQGEIGPELFEAACRMGLEGLVSKHRERIYRPGRCDHWVKVKNRKHPARVLDQF
jgi:hypothetical protein